MLYEIKGLTRIHRERTILDIPALTILEEKIYSLIGANGAGKTTLLHLLAFLDTPSSGTISFRSIPVRYSEKSLLPLRRQVVLVDQHPILFTGPVWKNLAFGLAVRKVEKRKRKPLIEEALEQVGMQDFFYAEAHKLSGGETKRVALARALVVQPQVLLCDEPTANIDTENLEIILDILARANRERKVSIIFTTHSTSQAQRLSRHALILKDGRLSNIPRGNVFMATLQGQDGNRSICRLQNGIRITIPTNIHHIRTGTIHLYLNPEFLSLAKKDTEMTGRENLLPGKIMGIAAEIDRIRITVDAGVPLSVIVSQSEYAKAPPLVGEEILLSIDDRAIAIE
jgi:tungstate transport system ATP-binding protein